MGCYRREYKAPDCPNCGKEDAARMGSSSWGHDISCCSDECGLAIAEKLRKNMDSKEYRSALKAYSKAESRVLKAKYRGIELMGLNDSIGNMRWW